MKCHECNEPMFVRYYHIQKDGSISRRRVCSKCNHTIKSVEVPKAEYDSLKRLSGDLRWSIDRYLQGRKRL